jgi:transcriptional regulator with XRE-family HTH domain
MAKTFRSALLDALEKTGLPLSKVAAGSGVSYDQLKKLRQRPHASTNVDDARSVANFFGVTLDQFLDDTSVIARVELVEFYSRLSDEEIEILKAAARGRGELNREAGS